LYASFTVRPSSNSSLSHSNSLNDGGGPDGGPGGSLLIVCLKF